MSLRMEAYLSGLPAVQAKLREAGRLPADISQDMKDTALAIQNAARTAAPVKTGNLRNRTMAYIKSSGEAGVFVDADYALAVEKGTRPHMIFGKPILSWLDKGLRFFSKFVKHPGTRAQPFFQPAVDRLSARLNDRVLRRLADLSS